MIFYGILFGGIHVNVHMTDKIVLYTLNNELSYVLDVFGFLFSYQLVLFDIISHLHKSQHSFFA